MAGTFGRTFSINVVVTLILTLSIVLEVDATCNDLEVCLSKANRYYDDLVKTRDGILDFEPLCRVKDDEIRDLQSCYFSSDCNDLDNKLEEIKVKYNQFNEDCEAVGCKGYWSKSWRLSKCNERSYTAVCSTVREIAKCYWDLASGCPSLENKYLKPAKREITGLTSVMKCKNITLGGETIPIKPAQIKETSEHNSFGIPDCDVAVMKFSECKSQFVQMLDSQDNGDNPDNYLNDIMINTMMGLMEREETCSILQNANYKHIWSCIRMTEILYSQCPAVKNSPLNTVAMLQSLCESECQDFDRQIVKIKACPHKLPIEEDVVFDILFADTKEEVSDQCRQVEEHFEHEHFEDCLDSAIGGCNFLADNFEIIHYVEDLQLVCEKCEIKIDFPKLAKRKSSIDFDNYNPLTGGDVNVNDGYGTKSESKGASTYPGNLICMMAVFFTISFLG